MVWNKFVICYAENVLMNILWHCSKTVIRFILCHGISIVTDYITLWGGARSGAVGLGTTLQAGRSRVRFPMLSLEFFIDLILSPTLWPWV